MASGAPASSSADKSSSSSSWERTALEVAAVLGMAGFAAYSYLTKMTRKQILEKKNEVALEKLTLNRESSAEDRRASRKKKRAQQLEEAFTKACRRREVVNEYQVGSLYVRELDGSERCNGTPVLEGFPAEGLSSSLIAQFLIELLELPLVGEILSESLPPAGVVRRFEVGGGMRIYGDERLVVIVNDYKFQGPEGSEEYSELVRDIVEVLFEFCERHESSMLISTESLAQSMGVESGDLDKAEQMMELIKKLQGGADDEDEDDEDGPRESLQDRLADVRQKERERVAKERRLRRERAAKRKLRKRKLAEASGVSTSASAPVSPRGGGADDSKGKEKDKEQEKEKDKDKEKEKEEDEDEEDDGVSSDDEEIKVGEVFFVCNDEALAQKMKALGKKPLRKATITGVTGASRVRRLARPGSAHALARASLALCRRRHLVVLPQERAHHLPRRAL
jgi:predicted ATP-grasp superfamily ATP-dependent carboligase